MKRFATLALAVALVLSVTACSSRDGDGSSSSSLPMSSSVPEPSSSMDEESSSSSLPMEPEGSSEAESAMSTDLEQIGTLDGTSWAGGPAPTKMSGGGPMAPSSTRKNTASTMPTTLRRTAKTST